MTDPQATPPADQSESPEQPEPTPTPAPEPSPEPPATTAGEENHADVDKFRGDDADAPADTGKSPQGS